MSRPRFASGDRIRADVLIGADGIHSTVREVLFGPLAPHFTGCVAYRGLVPAEQLKELELEVSSTLFMGPGGHFIHYFVQSERLVNFVAIVDRDTWTRESWTDRGEPADALAAFDGWHPQVRSDPRCRRRDVRLGALRPAAARALDARPGDAAR